MLYANKNIKMYTADPTGYYYAKAINGCYDFLIERGTVQYYGFAADNNLFVLLQVDIDADHMQLYENVLLDITNKDKELDAPDKDCGTPLDNLYCSCNGSAKEVYSFDGLTKYLICSVCKKEKP